MPRFSQWDCVKASVGELCAVVLMETLGRHSLAGITRLLFMSFLFLTPSTLSTAQNAVGIYVKRQSPASIPFRRVGGKEGRNSGALDIPTVYRSAGDRFTKRVVPASTASISASVLEGCSSAGCRSSMNSANRRPPIKFRPSLMIRGAVPLTDDTYFDFIEANPIVLVLFYVPWCSWSRKTLPEFDSAARVLAKEQSGEAAVLLAKVDCTQNEEVTLQEEIDEFPTLKLFVQGRPKLYSGGRQRADILRWVQLNLNQGRTVRSVDSLKEILASRALGTLVVIAAWGFDQKIAADASAQSVTPSLQNVGSSNETKDISSTSSGTLLPQDQKALRSAASHEGVNRSSPLTSSVSDSAPKPAVATNPVAPTTEKTALGRSSTVHTHGNRKEVVERQHSAHSQTEHTNQRETFSHVARLAGSNVIFGEASTPKVVEFLMDKYIRPHLSGKTTNHIQLPLIAAFPAKVEGSSLEDVQPLLPFEEVRLYDGTLDNTKSMADFVRASKFPIVVPFTEVWAPRIFDDGRPVCVLFVDTRPTEGNTTKQKSQTLLGKQALLKVAPEFRMQFLFTVAGNSKPHEKRLVTLLGIEEGTSFPQLRIVKFSPQGTGQGTRNHYPAVKYRPISRDNYTSARTVLTFENQEGARSFSKEEDKVPVHLPRSGARGLRTASAAQDIREEVRANSGETEPASQGEDEHSRASDYFEQELKMFLASYLEGSLEPYLRSEPVPSDEENRSALKIVVGSTFDELVRFSEEDVLVEFGAPWCGHCRKLEPTLRLLAEALLESKSTVVLAKMDATRNEVKGLYFVGYPTLILFPSKRKESPVIYKGDRTEVKLLEWLSRNVRGDHINLEQVFKIMDKKKQQTIAPEGMDKLTQIDSVLHQSYGTPLDQSVLEEL